MNHLEYRTRRLGRLSPSDQIGVEVQVRGEFTLIISEAWRDTSD